MSTQSCWIRWVAFFANTECFFFSDRTYWNYFRHSVLCWGFGGSSDGSGMRTWVFLLAQLLVETRTAWDEVRWGYIGLKNVV